MNKQKNENRSDLRQEIKGLLHCMFIIQGGQKVSVHLMITVQKNMQKYFKHF
jgi:hypothetical protein